MKRIIAVTLMISLLLWVWPLAYATNEDGEVSGANSAGGPAGTAQDKLGLVGASAILIDADTGEVLYEKNKDEQHYPASTTKMMTAILAIENLDLNKNIPIDADTPFTEGSRMYLIEGETISGKDVMYGMMLDSANDAAVAFAKKVSGTVEDFAKLMNEKAKEVGAKNTHFVNPNGLHDEKHVTTAYDLAMIARYCMRNETFRHYVGTYQYVIPATNKQQERPMYNTNRMLYDEKTKVTVGGEQRACKYEGITGIKTGYTSHAQGCLVASAKRGNMELIAVVLSSTDLQRFQDCIALLDYGFENYKSVKLVDAETDLGEVKVKRGSVNRVSVIAATSANAILPIDAVERNLRWEADLYPSLRAPVEKGQKAGVVQVYQGDKLIGKFDAVTVGAVSEGGFLSIFQIPDSTGKVIGTVFLIVLLLLLVLLITYIVLKRRQIRRKRKRRAEKKRREMESMYRHNRRLDDVPVDVGIRRDNRWLDDPHAGVSSRRDGPSGSNRQRRSREDRSEFNRRNRSRDDRRPRD